ncbi:hypothetical protein DPMN_114206 [Dreissena polymorpha]|uniref:Uncharacterized protein n=1 Tax=Dreissena polymorpha TaxID=45954 RepID=A0A9D4QSK8_DREPO|nr:hypothetical protein DPMN_114206 [Dreissena polymorpha]
MAPPSSDPTEDQASRAIEISPEQASSDIDVEIVDRSNQGSGSSLIIYHKILRDPLWEHDTRSRKNGA